MAAKKHHYIPKCYLKAWTGADGLLCEYRKINGRIITKRRHPSETGWSDSLYSVDTLPPESVDAIEELWFKRVDQDASNALDFYTQGRVLEGESLICGWSRFIMSLMQRHPGKIDGMWRKVEAELRRQYADNDDDRPEVKAAKAYFEANSKRLVGDLFAQAIQESCNLPNVGQHINNMKQSVVTLANGHGRFMTSDNPLFLSTGLGKPESFFLMPISPRHLWIAANTDQTRLNLIEQLRHGNLLDFVNHRVVLQAYSYSYAICENQLDFVEKHTTFEVPDSYEHLTVSGVEAA